MSETRRDRLRAATMREITQTARRILVVEGPQAVTLRAIAREMGVTAPALYRYFDSHQELVRHVIGDLFTELTEDLHAALKAVPPDDMAGKFMATAREFRRWALAHRAEYSLLFGTPLPGLDVDHDDVATECGRRFGWTFLMLFQELWLKSPFPVPPDEEIEPSLREQLERYREGLGSTLPLGALLTFLQCWIRLQGIVSLEAFGHLSFALDDTAQMFELMLAEIGPVLGLVYAPED
ncbi:TetR/AcrR family transcriptional regulator [Actinomadura sp. HBU206391]|uniref:TetR/AcrR family transcriptional regulator n=1 Tax=Actinomadura sp. HBU206391 TaxID=2731692 RepID=UPI00164F01B9|nr:TetR/AcrR family transcriptional regulator [Actinomadura sp. HBU206391]MBC6459772.1 TetR/AcrR family transcriptional regulator [Actinomadura sp. HBU206391]